MKKSKHFRKDVILARIIAAVILLVLIGLIVFGISLLKTPSGDNDNSENSESTQNTQNTESLWPEDQDTEEEGTEAVPETENQTEETPEVDENGDTTYEPEKVYVKIKVSSLRLREEPNTSCATLASIPKGTKLEVLAQEGIWYKVSYDGKVGYVSGTYVEVVEE